MLETYKTQEVSIIIPTLLRDSLKDTLSSLYQSILYSKVTAEVIIISSLELKNQKNLVFLINDLKENYSTTHIDTKLLEYNVRSAGECRNYGASNSSFQYLLFIDDDIILSKDSLEKIFKWHYTIAKKEGKHIVLSGYLDYPIHVIEKIKKTVTGRFLIKYGFTNSKGRYGSTLQWDNNDVVIKVPSVGSYCLFMHKKIFEKVEGYPYGIPYAGFEDYVISKKLVDAGIPMYLVKDVIVYHNEEWKSSIKNLYESFRKVGITRKAAVSLGYTELSINYPLVKKTVFKIGLYSKSFILWIVDVLNKFSLFSLFLFPIIKFLIGIAIFEGYYQNSYAKNPIKRKQIG